MKTFFPPILKIRRYVLSSKLSNYHNHYVCYMLLSWLSLLVTLCMGDVYNVLSSVVPLSCHRLMSMASCMVSYLVIFSCCLLFFPSIIDISKEPYLLIMCPKWDSLSFVIFASCHVLGLTCCRTHSFFLTALCISRALIQWHISDECIFFLLAAFTV